MGKKERSKSFSRTKGHSFEREIANEFKKIFPKAMRQLEYQIAEGVDLSGTGPYLVQCKRFKKYANPSRIGEIKSTGTDDWCESIPVLVTKADHKPTLAVLPLAHFLELVETHNAVFGGDE